MQYLFEKKWKKNEKFFARKSSFAYKGREKYNFFLKLFKKLFHFFAKCGRI